MKYCEYLEDHLERADHQAQHGVQQPGEKPQHFAHRHLQVPVDVHDHELRHVRRDRVNPGQERTSDVGHLDRHCGRQIQNYGRVDVHQDAIDRDRLGTLVRARHGPAVRRYHGPQKEHKHQGGPHGARAAAAAWGVLGRHCEGGADE